MPKVIGGSLASHREATRQRIFAALSTLMYERGYDLVSLADVAAEAGLARTAIYNYVPDKETLLVEFAVHETDRYLAQLHAALREVGDPVDQLATFVRLQIEYFAANHLPPGPALQFLLPESAYQRVLDHVAELTETLRRILQDGVDERYFDIDDVDAAVPVVVACINRERLPDDERQQHVDTTVAFVLRAVGVRRASDGTPQHLPGR